MSYSKLAQWLHLKWPAGKVEKLPKVDSQGRTNLPNVYVAGDLTGIPLLKMSLQSGANCVRDINVEGKKGELDLAIIGAGVAGLSAAAEAKKKGLNFKVYESSEALSTIINFPKNKPIYTYPTDMNPNSEIHVSAQVKESLLDELKKQIVEQHIEIEKARISHIESVNNQVHIKQDDHTLIKAKSAIIAIGRSGNYRKLNIPGEDLDKVTNRLHDPKTYKNKKVCVLGGGDSACEAAISIAELNPSTQNALVTLAYRGTELSRPKPENSSKIIELAQQGKIDLKLGTQTQHITSGSIELKMKSESLTIENDSVLTLIGREAPLDFFRRSKISIHGEYSFKTTIWLTLFFIIISLMYGMKNFSWLQNTPVYFGKLGVSLSSIFSNPQSFLGSMAMQSKEPGFWITLLYSLAVLCFGIDRIIHKKTPYIKLQTITLITIQWIPLFILPELILPWANRNQWVPEAIMSNLFTGYYYNSDGTIGSYNAYWHAYGFILAWPLLAWIVFSPVPLSWWLIIAFIQTFILIPFIVYKWGKGAYCGWICSCGALAETMGDRHREKMPHGPFWNKLNFIGQAILYFAVALLILHICMWTLSTQGWPWLHQYGMKGVWKPIVDYLMAGALGTGLYFAFSGRVWCRFACPLAALMHLYARFSKFRIIPEQKKCISCNACTSVCHQGIDIMNFANKGKPMEDPQCVRCSACVYTCPTGVLQFGQVDKDGVTPLKFDSLQASPVLAKEKIKENT